MPRRRTSALAALALALTTALAACGGEDDHAGGHQGEHGETDSSPSSSPSSSPAEPESSADDASGESPEAGGTRIEIERAGDAFTPNGGRVEATAGEPITLVITADAPGELHVHSTPEQEIAYDAGTSEHEVTIDRPGVVEVESHEPHLVVLQLEVR